MKISCQSCQAKYTIADEKVVGKIVKIRCKKCGATIVINGNEDASQATANAGGGAVADYTSNSADDQWTVNVAEGDQRSMSVQDIVSEYKSGVVTDDTYCWKDGMNDWLPLREIESLYAACTLGPAPTLQTNIEGFSPASLMASPPSLGASPPAAAEPAPAAAAGFGLFGGGSSGAEPPSNGGAALFGSGGGAGGGGAAATSAAANASVARRVGGRGTGGADLFGGAAQAGSEADVMTSAAGAGAGAGAAAAAATDASKMTGARNENSVLFSLSALTNDTGGPSRPSAPPAGGGGGGLGGGGATTATADGSGLIDIRALAQSMGVENNGAKGGNKVDDIMNLSGGGAFSAALAAPVLAPPPTDFSTMDSGSPSGGKNKTMLYALIGGGVLFLGVCIVVAASIAGGKKDSAREAETTKSSPAIGDTAGSAATATPAPTDTTAQPGSGAQPPTAGTAQATAPNTGTGTADKGASAAAPKTGGGGGGGASKSTGGGGGGAAATPPPAAADTPPPAPAKKVGSLMDEMNKSGGGGAPAPAAAGGGAGTAPFDKGAAFAALGAVNVASCKKPDGPTGAGKVRVTFEPNGSVSKVEFAEGPYTGTPVGGCILGKFRSAHVPAFSGAAVTAAKSFSVN